MTMDTKCPGCGKRLKNIKAWETHATRCKKLEKVMRLSYEIPTVNVDELAGLEVKLLPNSKHWGIWNAKANDWLRDKTGQTDSRVFQRNIKTLLSSVIAKSIADNVGNRDSK